MTQDSYNGCVTTPIRYRVMVVFYKDYLLHTYSSSTFNTCPHQALRLIATMPLRLRVNPEPACYPGHSCSSYTRVGVPKYLSQSCDLSQQSDHCEWFRILSENLDLSI